VAKKKKSIYSRRLKDINKDGKRNFGDTFLGDLLGADGKVGIGKGRPGLIDSLKGARREKPITKKPKAKPKKKSPLSDRHSGAGGSKSKNITDRRFDPPNVQPKRKSDIKTVKPKTDRTSGTPSFRDRSKNAEAIRKLKVEARVKGENVSDKAVPKDKKDNNDQQSSRNQQIYVSPYVKAISDFFKVDSVVKNPKGRNKARTGNSKGGMIDYRKTGMFYGGMTKRGKK
tara:strand:+ start:571 stop:1254 length:684 start_codon:yes stop_codon:yes gene_type:complete